MRDPSEYPVISGSASQLGAQRRRASSPDGGTELVWSTAPSRLASRRLVLTKLLLTLGAWEPGHHVTRDRVPRNDSVRPAALELAGERPIDRGRWQADAAAVRLQTPMASTWQQRRRRPPARERLLMRSWSLAPPREADTIISSWTGSPAPYWLFSDNASCRAPHGSDGRLRPAHRRPKNWTGHGNGGNRHIGLQRLLRRCSNRHTAPTPQRKGYLPNNYDAAMLIVAGIAYAEAARVAIFGEAVAMEFAFRLGPQRDADSRSEPRATLTRSRGRLQHEHDPEHPGASS